MNTDVFPLTYLEKMLKIYFTDREDLHNRILSSEELAEYLAWLASRHDGREDARLRKEAVSKMKGKKLSELGTRILDHADDSQAFAALRKEFSSQQEDHYIAEDSDISAGKVIRYMPAHWHSNEFIEISYVFSGECRFYFQNETLCLTEGSFLITAPDVVHANPCYHDDSVLIYFLLRRSTFDQVFWRLLPKENLLAAFFRQALGTGLPNALEEGAFLLKASILSQISSGSPSHTFAIN